MGARITMNCKKLNAISSLGQLPIPRVDKILDSLGKGRIFSLFDPVSSFHQITIDKDTIPLTAFCTPDRLFEWLVMPQGSNAAPGWFIKVVNEVIKGLERVAGYLDHIIVYDPDPAAHTANIRALFERLRKHNLKLSPSKAKIGATKTDFLEHTIPPNGVSPNADKVAALTKMPMPSNVKQTRPLLGGIGYYPKFLPELAKRLRPTSALLKQGINFTFTPAMEATVRQILHDLATHPVLVLTLSLSKAKIGATKTDFLEHTIPPDGVSPNADKVAALTNMPMPSNVKQTRPLLGGIGYYPKFLPELAKRLRPTSALLKQGINFTFTPAMEATVR